MSEYTNEYLLVYHKIYVEKQTSKHYSHPKGAQILKTVLKVMGGAEAQNILAAKVQRQRCFWYPRVLLWNSIHFVILSLSLVTQPSI